jgi:hypothetical protein
LGASRFRGACTPAITAGIGITNLHLSVRIVFSRSPSGIREFLTMSRIEIREIALATNANEEIPSIFWMVVYFITGGENRCDTD